MITAINILTLIELLTCIYNDVDAKKRIRSLNKFDKIDLNKIRRASLHGDGVFNVVIINLMKPNRVIVNREYYDYDCSVKCTTILTFFLILTYSDFSREYSSFLLFGINHL